ncbi:chloride channel protein [Ottowia thiooxydans]|uniref:chloride channel protein n=1 Tax=Ottowia thiooxydans TaxID=219182 RepID=UPI000405A861|nr:chloride channel protein [Ottowia thiooxydans]
MKGEPDFLRRVRDEMTDSRVWIDRLVIGVFALLAGLSVVLFTLLADAASQLFGAMSAKGWWWPLLWTPALTALVVWALRWMPGAGGSGPPQVMAALDSNFDVQGRSALVSLKISLAKVLAVVGALLAGLSVGRQGPSVQIAAGVMYSARRFLSPRSGITARELIVAGGAAGIAAAFNTPLGGVVFAIEELSRKLETRSSGLMLGAIVISGLVGVAAFGNLSYFGRIRIERVGWGVFVPGMLLALSCGLLGGLLARLLFASFKGLPDRFCACRRKWPVRFAAVCGLAVAVIGLLTNGTTAGGGHDHTRALLGGEENGIPLLWTFLKFIATWLTVWSGAPGGLFSPALAMGASLGHDVAHLMAPEYVTVLMALGMAGFLAALTQTPITAMIIVMEMVDGYAMVLGLMSSALVASLVSRMISRPLFSTLAEHIVQRTMSRNYGHPHDPRGEAEHPVKSPLM